MCIRVLRVAQDNVEEREERKKDFLGPQRQSFVFMWVGSFGTRKVRVPTEEDCLFVLICVVCLVVLGFLFEFC